MAWTGAGGDAGHPAREVVAELVDASGRARPLALAGPPRAVPDADGTVRYALTLAPSGVPAGGHLLRLTFVDPASRAVARSELAVRVD